MSIVGRHNLKKSIILCGESDGVTFKRTFHVVKKINEGASSICYEAYHGNSGRGILKEFYPQDAYGLERNSDGQLIHSPEFIDAYDRFVKAEREYIEPYKMLLDVKQGGADQDLVTFIPAFEIYHGCNPDGKVIGTTYVWTPEPKLETFDSICEEIHKHPSKNPEHKLVTVLTAIESLTKCICALHSADMIHRDIKPSNFGFIRRGDETLTQTLSMFDINSVCSVYGKIDGTVGTEGYMEPEAGYEKANNQTDIYSIGATLFNAIIVSDEAKAGKYLFNRKYYDRLRDMVNQSKLIQASEANSHPRLKNVLITILQKCLCERTYRYANCEELLEDLETALYYALPSEFARKNRAGEKWVLADMERSLDANVEKNSFLSIQYHLYEHPLYQCVPKSEDTINVLVIGFGNYGQKFLDACLQNGQIRNKKLCVTVLSDDLVDKEIYLSERPELVNFFNIDGSITDDKDVYGVISFEANRLDRDNHASITEVLQNVMCEHYDSKRPHYIFIALGDDGANMVAVNACKTASEILEADCIVSYVCENQTSIVTTSPQLYPLYVNTDIKASPLYGEIERMAFNTHLIWEKNLNVDYRVVRREFRKPYNHDSCVSSVLALKYKLYSMGIDLDASGFEDASRQFKQVMANKNNCGLKNELVWTEHRRWVTEKLCLGWRRIEKLEECAGGITKNEKAKKHVCIVRSRPNQKLAIEFRSNTNYDKWDTASSKDLAQLDELDRMSVELHRMFVKKAKLAKKQNLLSGNSIVGMRALIEGNRKAIVSFQEWFTCLKDIWNGDMSKVRLYKGLKNAFLSASDSLSADKKKSVHEQVKAFEAVFYPVMASMEYRDWKQDDVAFIDNIPFVLTYTENAYLAIPFVTGDNSDVFENVSAATVVNPARILYLYSVEKKQDIRDLQDTIPYVAEYMKRKHFKAAVEFVITVPESLSAALSDGVTKELMHLSDGRIRQVKVIVLNGLETVAQAFEVYLKLRASNRRFFAVEKNTTMLSYLLQGAGLYNSFSNYAFDSLNMKFNSMVDCEMLSNINKAPYITVTDMVAFRLSSSESSNQPEFFEDYKDLWKKYTEKSGVWKSLCDLLADYTGKNDTIVSFKKKTPKDKNQDVDEFYYVLPFVCSRSAEKIICFLKEQGIVEQGSRVSGHTTGSCKVNIVDCCGYRGVYDKLFANVYALMFSDAISLHLNTKSHEVNVVFDNLVVDKAQIPTSRVSEFSVLMEFFKGKGYVINLKITPDGKMSFTYATRQIKELLSTAGKMLEVYTYHKIKELGNFDDVVSSFEIDWEGTDVKSEFDCILTKGFRTLFVECKARSDIEQEFYFKLSKLAERFGINATAVLIADTKEKNFYDNAHVNAMQRRRGSMMDVVTIWKPDEINNIGHTLLKVINDNYVNEEE
jgi:hypothetical protein